MAPDGIRHFEVGTDGIRGEYGTVITEGLVRDFGRAILEVTGMDLVYVGRDTRESGKSLAAAAFHGIRKAGAVARYLDVITTPGVAYVSAVENAAGLMLTASHNPYTDNGAKLFVRGQKASADDMNAMADIIRYPQSEQEESAEPLLSPVMHDMRGRYESHLVSQVQPDLLAGKRLVLDAANGAASIIGMNVLGALKADVLAIASDTENGRNINDGCGATNPENAQLAVISNKADAGITLDGDADRVMLVDKDGALINGDRILLILALWAKHRGNLPGNAVVGTTMSNLGLEKSLNRHGIELVRADVGDKYVLAEMAKRRLTYGGEQSGHILIGDPPAPGDGLYTALKALQVVADSNIPLHEWAAMMEDYPQKLIKVPVPAHYKTEIANHPDVLAAVERVGVELRDTGRVIVRPSGTEQVVRIMVEAKNKQNAEEGVATIEKAVVNVRGQFK